MPMAPHGGPLPITGSHEPAGVVVAIGPFMDGARMERFKVGDRVMAVNNTRHCGEYTVKRRLGDSPIELETVGTDARLMGRAMCRVQVPRCKVSAWHTPHRGSAGS